MPHREKIWLVVVMGYLCVAGGVAAEPNVQISGSELTFRTNSIDVRNSSMNPDNILAIQNQRMTVKFSPVLDYRPNPTIMVTAHPVLRMDMTSREGSTSVEIPEWRASFIPSQEFSISVGKQPVYWGAGHGWDLITIGGADIRMLQESPHYLDVVYADYFLAKASVSAYAIFNHSDCGIRYHWLENDELTYDVMAGSSGGQLFVGGDVSMLRADSVEFHAQGTIQHGSGSYEPLYSNGGYEWVHADDSVTYATVLCGLQWISPDDYSVMAEYFYNGLGISRGQDVVLKAGIRDALLANQFRINPQARGFLLGASGGYQFARTYQNYLFFRVAKSEILPYLAIECPIYMGLDDGGGVILPMLQYTITDMSTFSIQVYVPYGPDDSEFLRYYNRILTAELAITW